MRKKHDRNLVWLLQQYTPNASNNVILNRFSLKQKKKMLIQKHANSISI